MKKLCNGSFVVFLGFVLAFAWGLAYAEDASFKTTAENLRELQKTLDELTKEVDLLKKKKQKELDAESPLSGKFNFGGYGEIHANLGEGAAADKLDIHRLVFYLGYDFNDWIRFHSETEIEHAVVSSTGDDGELAVEQAYVDFLLSSPLNVRFGRFLTPLGIINRKHEPPSFNGVERPELETFIIPSTWSSDGIGVFGSISPSLKYELYAVGGLDGSKFNARGIRNGRIDERPSLHAPALTGRLDFYPFAEYVAGSGQTLRIGFSGYIGGLNNANNDERAPNTNFGDKIRILSADFEYTISKFDFRGVIAHEKINGAEEIGHGTASEILGWYLEGAWRFLPDAWKKGKLAKSDAVVFIRHDDFDTQYQMPAGIAADPAGRRTTWTTGINFYPVHNFVIKADYQIRHDESSTGLANLFNMGVGWEY